MADLNKRIAVMCKILEEKPNLGKTAMVKYVFLLQKVYKVPLGYDFEIYTYGPYSSEVVEDIDYARHLNIIAMERVEYPRYIGYSLSLLDNANTVLCEEKDFVSKYHEEIKEVVELFGDKTAKDLELATTIIYLYGNYIANGWKCTLDEISSGVHDIKPHFSLETIKDECRHLDNLGILKRVAQN